MRGVPSRVLLALLAIMAPACGGDHSPTAPDRQSQPSGATDVGQFVEVTPPSAPPGPGAFGDGKYRVNRDIMPGRYFTRQTSDDCDYLRESNAAPGTNVIAGHYYGGGGQWIIEIAPTDTWFETAYCGLWSSTPNGGLQRQFGPGMWLVGTQVAPGRYRSNGSIGAFCVWSRLQDLDNTDQSWIASGHVPAGTPATVTIEADDVAFTSENCSAWTPVQ